MYLKILFLTLLFSQTLFQNQLMGQETINTLDERKAINLKTNIAHFLFGPPPLHIEFQTQSKQSLTFGAYYLDYVFISSRYRGAGSTLSYRFYINQRDAINGFYLGIGTIARLDMNDLYNAPSFNFFKNFFVGIRPSLGLQFQKRRWIGDLGMSYNIYPGGDVQPSILLGFGYRIW
jgi:hypothetical protein